MTIPIIVLALAVMGIRTWFYRRRSSGATPEALSNRNSALSAEHLQLLTAWSNAAEAGELCAPTDVHDPQSWDRYWRKQIEVGTIEQGFNDMMSSDPNLVAFLKRRGVRTILCVGPGLSSEPLALAVHGFDVTALDISDIPREALAGTAIDPHRCPPIHRSDDPPRGGGSLSYVTGDLADPTICPGPFDAVIERRTVQLFPDAERRPALDRLVARLGSRAFLLCHQHRGNWRPDQPLTHYADEWLKTSDFVSAYASNASGAERVARLYTTTG